MKKQFNSLAVLLGLVLVGSSLLVAQQHQHATPAPEQKQEQAQKDNMTCPHRTAMAAALQGTEDAIAEGLKSDDPAKMKTALEQAKAQLATMKKHMQMCPMMSGPHMGTGAHEHDMMKGQAKDKSKPE